MRATASARSGNWVALASEHRATFVQRPEAERSAGSRAAAVVHSHSTGDRALQAVRSEGVVCEQSAVAHSAGVAERAAAHRAAASCCR